MWTAANRQLGGAKVLKIIMLGAKEVLFGRQLIPKSASHGGKAISKMPVASVAMREEVNSRSG